MSVKRWWNGTERWKSKYTERKLPQCQLLAAIPMWYKMVKQYRYRPGLAQRIPGS